MSDTIALVTVIRVMLAVLAVVIAALFYPPIRLSALVMAGRSPACPLPQAIHSEEVPKRQLELKDEILNASKMIGKDDVFEQWQTPMGTYWIKAGSRYVLPFNLAEQKRQIYFSGAHRINKGDIVLDCGANIGVFVREALNAGAAKVVAIEPAPENIEALRRNFAPEIASGSVIVYPKGVWDKIDLLTLNVDDHNSAADSFVMNPEHAHTTETKFELTTIDNLVAELKLPKVDFIKMDIEGAEVKALHGGKQTIEKWHPRMSLSVYHEPSHPVEVPKAVRAAWPGVKQECGPCQITKENTIRPDIYYFH